jgi:hypothetical protein
MSPRRLPGGADKTESDPDPRRRALVAGGVWAAAAALALPGWHNPAGATPCAALGIDLGALRAIAAFYRREYGDQAAVLRLYRAYRRCAEPARGAELVRWLERGRAEDFAAGRVVVLSGWVLARSEARVCAMLAMIASRR